VQPLELSIQLTGEPARLGLSWRTDDAEPDRVIVTQVIPHSPAALAGLKPLDRIRRFGQSSSPATAELTLPSTVILERDGILSTVSIKPTLPATVAGD
jgi:C-terminal processing protease CtpA/Prc